MLRYAGVGLWQMWELKSCDRGVDWRVEQFAKARTGGTVGGMQRSRKEDGGRRYTMLAVTRQRGRN